MGFKFNAITGKFDLTSAGYVPLVDTRANILASTATSGNIAFATDVERFYVYDGTSWQESAVQFSVQTSAPNMGAEQNESRQGYGSDYITDKRISNSLIGGNARTENGGLRVDITNDPNTIEVYLRDAWQTILYDLTTDNGDFRHAPVDEEIYVWRGDSVAVGLNNRPRTQEYQTSMGAFPPVKILDGGSF